jgi:DNA-binding SARP family transcriptional activator
MGRQRDEGRSHKNLPVTERQADYSLNRLTTAVNGISRLRRKQSFSAVERMLTELDNATEYRAGSEILRKLRLWRADYLRLSAELDTASSYFHLTKRGLIRRVDAKIDDWEQRFESASQDMTVRPAVGTGRRGWLRRLIHRQQAPVVLDTTPEEDLPKRLELTGHDLYVPRHAYTPIEIPNADIAARVLGPLELNVAGTRVFRWSSLKARAIFQYLLIHLGRPIRREALMELEWPEHTPNSARNNLNVALYSLRNTLDQQGLELHTVLYKEGCYLLNPALTYWTDRNEFLSMIRGAQQARRTGSGQQAISACRSAVQLYRGPLFEDDLAGEWYLPERRKLKELYLQTLEYLAEAYCESGQLRMAVEFGQQAISADPCYEAAHRLLMRCYARQQQQQLVSRQYQLCTAALRNEFAVSPAAETIQLFHALTSTA